MKKFIFLKNKIINHIDNVLKKRFFDGKWNILSLPGNLYLTQIINAAGTLYAEFLYPKRGINMVIYNCMPGENKIDWLINEKEYIKRGEKVVNDKKFIKLIEKDFDNITRKFYLFTRKLEKNSINKTNLREEYEKFLALYIFAFSIAYCATGPVTLGYADFSINKLLKKYNYSSDIVNAVKIFTKPNHNFVFEEEKDLIKIVLLAKKERIKISNLNKLKLNNPKIYELLKKHQENYYWICNNYYYVKYLDLKYFFNRIKQIIKENKRNNESKEKIKIKSIDKKDIILLKKLGYLAGFHDKRKKVNLIANYWLMQFLEAVSKKFKIPLVKLKFASFLEIRDLLYRKKIDFNELKNRKRGCIIASLKDGSEYWLTGENYNLFVKRINKLQKLHNKNIILGVVANPGKVKGVVKVLLDVSKEGNKIKKGDILVTSMTRPEFVPFLKMVSGIITNEGGITSHAGTLSREFKIPCIVGTQIATKVLKDGDLVEVDANRGVVRKL